MSSARTSRGSTLTWSMCVSCRTSVGFPVVHDLAPWRHLVPHGLPGGACRFLTGSRARVRPKAIPGGGMAARFVPTTLRACVLVLVALLALFALTPALAQPSPPAGTPGPAPAAQLEPLK